MWIFVGVPTVVLLTTAIFGDLGGYFFGNVRDKTSNILHGDMLPLVGL